MWADLRWAVWAVLTLALFLGFEFSGPTLSERLRRWFGVHPHRPWRKAATLAFLMVLALGATLLGWHIAVE